MLDKFKEVYARLIAESVTSQKTSLKKTLKNKKKRLIKEQSAFEQTMTVTFTTDADGVHCYAGNLEGVGATLDEAFQDFAGQFSADTCSNCFNAPSCSSCGSVVEQDEDMAEEQDEGDDEGAEDLDNEQDEGDDEGAEDLDNEQDEGDDEGAEDLDNEQDEGDEQQVRKGCKSRKSFTSKRSCGK